MDYDDFSYEDNESPETTPYSVEDAGDEQRGEIYTDPRTGKRIEILDPFREAEAENAAVEKKTRALYKREEDLKKEMKRFTDLTREEKEAASTAGVVQRKKWRREAETGLSSGEGFWNDTWQVLSDLSGTYDSGEEPAITKNQNALVKIFEGDFKKKSQLRDLMNDSDKLGLRDSGVQFNKWMESWARTEDIKQYRRWLEANGYLTRDDDGKLVSGGREDMPGYDKWKQMRSNGYITGYEGTDKVEDSWGYGTRQEYLNAYAKEARRYAGEILRDRAIRKMHAQALLDYSDKSDRRSSIDEALEAGYENIPYTLQFAKPLVAGASSFIGRAGKLTRDNVELNPDSDDDIDVIKGDDVLPALGRAALGAGAEVATELYLGKLAGKLFNGMGALTKSGLQKTGIWDKGAKIAQKTGADKIGRAVNNLMWGVHRKLSKTLHYDGIIGEMAEEFVQQVIDNSWLGQSDAANEYYGNSLKKSVKEFIKTDNLRELLFGTTATMLLLGGVAAGRRKMIEHNLTPKMDATLKDNYGMTDDEIKGMSFRKKLSLLGFGYDDGKYAGKFQKRGWLEDETDNWGRTLDEALSDLGIKDSVVRGLTNEQKLKYLNYTMSVDDMSKEDRLKFAEALGDTMSNIVEKIHTANKLHDAFGENEASDWQSYKSKFNMPTATDESGRETPAWRTAEDGTRYVYDEGSGVGIKENSDGTYTVSHFPTGYTENVVKKGDHRNMATAALAKAHEISKRAEEAADLRSKKDKVVKGLEGSLTGNTRIVTFANVDEALKSGLSEETKNELRKQITDDNGKRRYTLKQRVKALRDDSGNIIVFLDNIKSVRDVRRSVIHEMLHSALADVEKDPSLIKNKRLTKLIKKFTKDGRLRDVLDRMIGDEATRYEAGWLGMTDYSGMSDDVLMEEALAKRSEKGIGDASGMERAVSWMRGILSDAGIDLKMNSSDVAVFMQELRDIARSGSTPGIGEAAPVSGAYGSPEAEGRKVDSEEGWKYTSELAPEQAVDTPKRPKSRPKAAESEDDIPDAGETVRRPPMKKSVNKSKATKPKEEPTNEARADEEPAKPAPQARPVEEKDKDTEPATEAPESPEAGAKVETAEPRDEEELAERERALISHLPDDVVLQMYNSLVAERSKQIKALAKEMSADKYKQALDALGELNARIARMEAIPRVKELLAQHPAPAKKTARKAAPKASVKKTEEQAKPVEKPETSESAEQETEPDDGKTLEEMAEEQEQEKPEPAAEQEQKEPEPAEEQAEEPTVPEQETTEESAPDNADAVEEEEAEPTPEPEKTEEEKLRDVIENPQEDESEDTKKLRETLEKITPIRNRLKEIKQRNDEIDQEDLVITARLKQLDVEENDANARYSELLDIYENEDGDHTEAEQKAAKEEMDKIDARAEEIKKERDDINARRKAFADEITKLDTEENDLQNQFDMYTKDAKDLQAHFAASKGEIKGVFAGGVGETVAEEAGGPSAVLADVMNEAQPEAEEDAEEEGKEENEPVKDNRSETLAKVRPVQRNAKRIENLYAAMPKRRAETDLAIEEHRRDEMVSTLRLADKRTLGDGRQYDRDLVQSMIDGLQKELSALNGGTKRSADTDKKQDRLRELTLLRDAHDRLDQTNAKIEAMRKALADIDSSTKDEIQKNGTDVKEGKQLNKYIASAISRVQKTLEKPLTDKERTEFTEHLNDIMEFGSRFAVAMAEYSRRGAEGTQTTQEAVSRRNDVLSVMSSEAQKGLEAIESNSSTARTNLLMASAAFNTLTQMNKKPQTEEWKGKKVPKGTSLWGGDGGATLKWLVGEKVVGGTSRAENWEQNKALAEKIFRYNAEHKMGRTIRFRLESEEEQPKTDNRFMGGKAKTATTLPVSTAPEIGYQNGKVRFLLVGNEAMNALADKGVPEAKKAVKGLDKAIHMLLTLPSRQNAIDATLGQARDRTDLGSEYLEIAKNTRRANVGGRLVDRLQDIKKETGWELGVDGKWRYELFDAEKILLDNKETGAKWDTGKILRVMRRWYPGLQISFVPFSRLRKAGVKLNTKKTGVGWLLPLGKNHYELAYEDKSSRDGQADTIIHELQHLVQEQEGLAEGSTPGAFTGMYKSTGLADMAQNIRNDISRWKAKEFGDGQVQLGPLRTKVESWIAQIEQSKKLSQDKNQAFAYSRLVDTLKMTVDEIDSQRRWGTFNKDRANDIWKDLGASLQFLAGLKLIKKGDIHYSITAGEIEARNVERRMKMPEAERRGTLAADTQSALGIEGHQPLEWEIRSEGRGTRMKPVRFRLASDAESNGDEPSAAMLRADVQDGPGSRVFDSPEKPSGAERSATDTASTPSISERLGKIKDWFPKGGEGVPVFRDDPADWSMHDSSQLEFDRTSKETRLAEAVGGLENPGEFWKAFLPTGTEKVVLRTKNGNVALLRDVHDYLSKGVLGYTTAIERVADDKFRKAGATHMFPHIAECGYVGGKSVLTAKEINDNFQRCLDSPIKHDELNRPCHEVDIGYGVKMRICTAFIRVDGKMAEVPITMKAIGRNAWKSEGLCKAVAKEMSERKPVPISTESGATTSTRTEDSIPQISEADKTRREELLGRLKAGETLGARALRFLRRTGGVPGVRFRLAPSSPSGSGAVDMNADESRVDSIRRKYQDFLLPLKRLQHRLGIKDFSDEDVYHAYDRAFGYKENDVLRLDHDHVKPIMKFMKDNDISMEEATEFLNMAFAKERNQMIRDRDPSQDAGSGITDDEADDYFRDLKTRHPERYKTLNAFGKKVWRMNHQTLDRLVDSGIMSGEQANYYKTYSPHYVPLVTVGQVFDDNSDYMSGLSGGQLTEHALGRKSKAEDPLLVSVSQAQRAIVLARNNEVLRGLADLVRNHLNGVGIVRGTLPKQERYDRKKNRIVNRGNKRVSPDADIKFFENGKEMWIRLNGSLGEQVGRAISGKSIERSGVDALSKTARAVSRTFAAMRTTFSPEFTAGNLARDNAQAVFLLGGWYGIKSVKDFEAAMPMAMTNAVRILHGKQAVGDDAKYAQEWFDNGGMIGGKVTEAISTLDTRMRAMVDRFDNSPMAYLKRKASIPLRYIELFNQPFEMSTRMAAYIAMRKNGVDVNEAIAKSRDITANFNRKGENTGFINSYWLFSNAIVQGMAPTIPVFANALKAKGRTAESNRALGTLVAATTLGLILSALNNAGGGDDDDEKDGDASYDHETEFNKQNNLIINLDKFGAKGLKAQFPLTGQVRIPIYLGEVIGDAIFGKKGTPAERAMDAAGKFAVHVADEALDVTGAQVGAMAGLEGGKEHGQLNMLSIFSAMAPTAVRPLIEMATGRTWSGQDMTAKKFNDEQPDSDTSFNTTGKGWKALAKALNKMSGGSDNRSGWLDFAPETLRYAVSYLAGGIGSTGGRFVASIGGDDYGEHTNPQNIPFVNRFLRRQQDSTSDYYDRYSEWARLVYEVEHTDWTSDDPDTKNRAKELVRISPLLANESALKELKNTSRIISALRKVETSDEESDETKKKAKTIRLRMQKAYLDFTEEGGPAKRDYSQFYEDYGTLLMLSKPQRGGR